MAPNFATSELDHVALAKYINVAKGPYRNMAQFSKDTGISSATLSRILNGRYKKPISIDFIGKIYQNRYDQSDRALLWYLMAASGTAPDKEEALFLAREVERQTLIESSDKKAKAIKNALVVWLLACGNAVNHVESNQEYSSNSMKSNSTKFDSSKKSVWFSVNVCEKNSNNINRHQFFLCLDHSIPPLSNTYGVFLEDAWTPEALIDTKTSFVFVDDDYYHSFLAATCNAKINTTMSVLLLDSEFNVVTEKNLPYSAENPC